MLTDYSTSDTLAIVECIRASQQMSIDGRHLLPSRVMSRKEGDLLRAHPIDASEARTI